MRPGGQLDRSLAALTIGVALDQRDRETSIGDNRTTEYEQQVHVPLAGYAGNTHVAVDKAVTWELPFLYAPMQRRVPFETPHFTYGVEFGTVTAVLVLVQAHLIGWTITEQNWYVGATIRFSVVAPALGAGIVEQFNAIAHLSFQGYASHAEGAEFQNGTN